MNLYSCTCSVESVQAMHFRPEIQNKVRLFTTNFIQSEALPITNSLKKVHKPKLLSFRSDKSTKFEISQFYLT